MKKLLSIISLVLASAAAQAEISISDAYVREMPPATPNTAAFMALSNSAEDAVTLVSASTSAAANVELHEHVHQDGKMMMRQVEGGIVVPGGEEVTLEPGGLHVMLFDLVKPLYDGDQIELTLNFSDNSSQTLLVPVKKVMAHH